MHFLCLDVFHFSPGSIFDNCKKLLKLLYSSFSNALHAAVRKVLHIAFNTNLLSLPVYEIAHAYSLNDAEQLDVDFFIIVQNEKPPLICFQGVYSTKNKWFPALFCYLKKIWFPITVVTPCWRTH